jgi:nucleoside-diphosphate-sugar epimerase
MTNVLVTGHPGVPYKTIKTFVENDRTHQYFFPTEKELNFKFKESAKEFIQENKIEKIVYCESKLYTDEYQHYQENTKILRSLFDISVEMNVDKVLLLGTSKIYDLDNKIKKETDIEFSSCQDMVERYKFDLVKVFNKANKTKFLMLIHGDLISALQEIETESFSVNKLIEAFVTAKSTETNAEIEFDFSSRVQLTYADGIADIALFLCHSDKETNKIPVWNLAANQVINVSELIWKIQGHFPGVKNISLVHKETKQNQILSTEKFIEEFVDYPHLSIDEGLRRTINQISEKSTDGKTM